MRRLRENEENPDGVIAERIYESEQVGNQIRKIRKRNKMNQATLAELLYLSVDSISNIENGKQTCMPEHVTRLCQIFNISADYFYFDIERKLVNTNQSEIDTINSMLYICSESDIIRIRQMIEIILVTPTNIGCF